MFTSVKSMGLFGMHSYMVHVEIDVSGGLPHFDIVGLPNASVSEAKERVRSAIKNSGLTFPVSRITVNLAPADTKKEGTVYDLPMLIAVLSASRQIKRIPETSAFIGELSLGGELRKVNGALPMVIEARNNGITDVFVPKDNAYECSVVSDINVYPVENIKQLVSFLEGSEEISHAIYTPKEEEVDSLLDFADVKTIMKNRGLAHMGLGRGKGENRTIEAVRQAVSSPLLETTIEGATGIILNIKGGLDLTLEEVYEAADLVKEVVDPTCNIIFGSGIEEDMENEVEITVIATGFSGATLQDDMKKEVIKSVSGEIERHTETIEDKELFNREEAPQERMTSRVEIDDSDIPPFLRKIKKNRF